MSKARLTPKAAEAITRLRASHDWRTTLEWIADLGAEWNQVLIQADNPDRRAVSAGMARAITLIVAAVEEAPQVFEQMKEKQL